jgi:hypothetical protein
MTAIPPRLIICIEDEKPGLAFLVKKICAESDLTSQVIKQVAHVQWFVDTDVAAVIKLVGVQVPTLDEPLGQHQGRTREFGVWKWQAFGGCHCRTSIAHLGNARQAKGICFGKSRHENEGGLAGILLSRKRKPLAR